MDKTLFQNRFLALIDRDGYSFAREVRCDGVIAAILPFRTVGETSEFLARVEICPAHGPNLGQYSFTGGVESNETIEDTAVKELMEEAGFQVKQNELIRLGQVRPSKCLDTIVHLFAVDVTGKPQFAAQGDGSPLESTASSEWVDYETGIHIQDALFLSALIRLVTRRNHGASRNQG